MNDVKNISLFGKNKIIGLNIPSENTNETFNLSELKVKVSFSSFDRPKNLNKKALNIILDNSFDYEDDDYILFLDHHLVEEQIINGNITKNSIVENFHKMCPSNSQMLYSNYIEIYNVLFELLKENFCSNIHIYIHNDLDGFGSGIIIKKLLNDIKNGNIDEEYESKIKMALIMGNYGDINENAKYDLADFFNSDFEINIFDKKIKSFCKTMSRFMKAVRSLLPHIDENNSDIEKKLNEILRIDNIDSNHIRLIIKQITNDIENMEVVDTKSIIVYMNVLANNIIISKILKIYNDYIEFAVKNYIDPETSCVEMTIIFKNDSTKTKYKLMIIDTPFDCGRSVLWKYRTSLKAILKGNSDKNPWYYKVSDWIAKKDLMGLTKNIICYNKMINKVSLDSSNNSSFDIAKQLFGGGGHILEDEMSLGSAKINETDFLNSFIILEIF